MEVMGIVKMTSTTKFKTWVVCPGCSNLLWNENEQKLIKVENIFPPVEFKWCRLCLVTWKDEGDPGIPLANL